MGFTGGGKILRTKNKTRTHSLFTLPDISAALKLMYPASVDGGMGEVV